MEPGACAPKGDRGLAVIVPRNLPWRAALLTEALAGTTIRVIVDRRQGERRHADQSSAVQRRRRDRRAEMQIVAFVYACPVIALDPVAVGGPAEAPDSGRRSPANDHVPRAPKGSQPAA